MSVAGGGDLATMSLDGEFAAHSDPMTISQAVQSMGYDDIADFAAAFDAMEPSARDTARAVLNTLLLGE